MRRANQQTILITGCSSGIGWTCASGMKARGWRVLATARRVEDLQRLADVGLETIQLELRDPSSVAACAEEALERTDGKLFA
ncbi:MAG: SDR family NAD(P)-dependent oxidoreductase, partial [Hyphomicrobiaceae bacterium]